MTDRDRDRIPLHVEPRRDAEIADTSLERDLRAATDKVLRNSVAHFEYAAVRDAIVENTLDVLAKHKAFSAK